MDGGSPEGVACEEVQNDVWDAVAAERAALVRLAAHALIDRSAAEDAVHDVLATLLGAGDLIASDELPGALRRRVRWRVGELNRAARRVTPIDPILFAEILPSDDEYGTGREEYAALADVLPRLDEHARRAIRLRYGSGMTHAAIAAEHGGSAAESARATARARSVIRRLVAQREQGHFCDEVATCTDEETDGDVARRIARHVRSCLHCSRVTRRAMLA